MTGWTKHGYADVYKDDDGDSLNVIVDSAGNILFDVTGHNGCQVRAEDLTTLIDILVAARDKAASDGMEERARVLATEIRHAHGAYVTGAQIDEWLKDGYEYDSAMRARVVALVTTARVAVTWDMEDGS